MSKVTMPEPLFWFRLRSDGGHEGPLHDAIIGEVRKQSDAWIPFFSVSQIEAYAAAKVREALEKAASLCDELANNDENSGEYAGCAAHSAARIRALIPSLPGPVEPTT